MPEVARMGEGLLHVSGITTLALDWTWAMPVRRFGPIAVAER